MNCKKGDLVMIYRVSGYGLAGRISKEMKGRFATVTRLAVPRSDSCSANIVWIFEEPIDVKVDGVAYTVLGCADDHLRPIRNPGDDAVDESKAWLPPVPLPTINPEMIPTKEEASQCS